MVSDASIAVAIRCKNCGRQTIESINYFELKAKGFKIMKCRCKQRLLKMESSDLKTFHVSIPCLACDEEHLYILKWDIIPFHKMKILTCLTSTHDIAFIGDYTLVRKTTAQHERDFKELIESI